MLNGYKRFCFLKTIIKSEEIKRIVRGSHTIEGIIIMFINETPRIRATRYPNGLRPFLSVRNT